jgi:hypothetical protein
MPGIPRLELTRTTQLNAEYGDDLGEGRLKRPDRRCDLRESESRNPVKQITALGAAIFVTVARDEESTLPTLLENEKKATINILIPRVHTES